MVHRTLRSSKSLMDPVDGPEKIVRGRVSETSIVLVQMSIDDNRPPRRDKNTRFVEEQMTVLLQKKGIENDRRHSRSGSQKRSQVRDDAVIPRLENTAL